MYMLLLFVRLLQATFNFLSRLSLKEIRISGIFLENKSFKNLLGVFRLVSYDTGNAF